MLRSSCKMRDGSTKMANNNPIIIIIIIPCLTTNNQLERTEGHLRSKSVNCKLSSSICYECILCRKRSYRTFVLLGALLKFVCTSVKYVVFLFCSEIINVANFILLNAGTLNNESFLQVFVGLVC